MAYKHVLYCPRDGKKLPNMLGNNTGQDTYHCEDCDSYWHFQWFKYRSGVKPGWVWRVKYVRDDFGTVYENPLYENYQL